MSTEKNQNDFLDEELDEEMDDCAIMLTDEDGNEQKFFFIDSVDYKDEQYAVLATEEEPDSVVILKYTEEGENEVFSSVEDEETLKAVFDLFVEAMGDGCGCGCGCDCDCEDGECDCDCEDDDCDCGCCHHHE
jgi:uncharacterized protein YrzB (UPF0473 family)